MVSSCVERLTHSDELVPERGTCDKDYRRPSAQPQKVAATQNTTEPMA